MIGMRVEFASEEIQPSGFDKVYWSGTTMHARFVDKVLPVKKGEKLYIVEVKENTLICLRHKSKN